MKIPRWTFEKFPEADETLTTQMKSVGEAMSIGRTFKEAFQKAVRSMEVKRFGFGLDRNDKWLAARRATASDLAKGLQIADRSPVEWPIPEDKLTRKLAVPSQGRLYYVRYAFKMGWTIEQVFALSKIDPWFLEEFRQLVAFEDTLCKYSRIEDLPRDVFFEAKRMGYSDAQLANLYLGSISADSILHVRACRKALGIEPVYKLVDTCAAEFEAVTPYYYSTYEAPFTRDGITVFDDEIRVTNREKIVILGGGPNRIGQGIEFDYCCCQAAFACENMGFESVMINSNPETVSTDYDTSDLLFFEPLTLEDVLNVIERLNGGGTDRADRSGKVVGAIVQFGGQTPLNLAHGLAKAGVPLVGTGLDSIDLAEDRDRFKALLDEMGLKQPPSGIARSLEQAVVCANVIGYPVLVRPSYVLGGRGMEICPDESALRTYMTSAVNVSDLANAPVLIDRFLSDAIEVDVDVVADFEPSDGTRARMIKHDADAPRAIVCGVMEHIEEAGIHSGDSTCIVPPFSLSPTIVEEIRGIAMRLAERLKVRGLMNVQFAVKGKDVYILEVNPRASRTSPFVGKAKGVAWPFVAAQLMMGRSLATLGTKEIPSTGFYAVKESVFPFAKFPGVDVVLGPEMRSTGEVMGADRSLPIAFAKAQMAAGVHLPTKGNVFLSVRDGDKEASIAIARDLRSMGFEVYTSKGTAAFLKGYSVDTKSVNKLSEGARPTVLDLIANGEIHLIINTPTRKGGKTDEGRIRATAVRAGIPMITTMSAAKATVDAIAALRAGAWTVTAIQDYFPHLARPKAERKAAELVAS